MGSRFNFSVVVDADADAAGTYQVHSFFLLPTCWKCLEYDVALGIIRMDSQRRQSEVPVHISVSTLPQQATQSTAVLHPIFSEASHLIIVLLIEIYALTLEFS